MTKKAKSDEDGTDGKTNDDGDNKTNDDAAGTDDKAMSQDDVNRLLGKTRSEAKRAAQKEIADELGISVEEAKALLTKQREADEAQMTEAEKIRAEAEKMKTDAEATVARAWATQVEAEVTKAMLTPGEKDDDHPVRADRLALATRLALPEMRDATPETLDEAAVSAVALVRSSSPEWFTVTDNDSGGKTKTPDTPGRPHGQRKGQPDTSAKAKAEALMARHGRQSRRSPTEGFNNS